MGRVVMGRGIINWKEERRECGKGVLSESRAKYENTLMMLQTHLNSRQVPFHIVLFSRTG